MNKKFKWFQFLAILTVFGLFLTSCRMDDSDYEPLLPVEVADVPGEYQGKTVVKSGQISKTFDAQYSAEAANVSISAFPLEPLLREVISDELELKEALESMEDVTLTMPYTGKLLEHGKEVILTLEPGDLDLIVPFSDGDKEVSVKFKEASFGSYYATAQGEELFLAFSIEEINVDNEAIPLKSEISYLIGGFKK